MVQVRRLLPPRRLQSASTERWELPEPVVLPLDEVRATRDQIAARFEALVVELDAAQFEALVAELDAA